MHNKSEDRGMMKWNPFYSVMSEAEIRSSVDKKVINEKPEFSEDQIMEMEETILYAFNNNKEVTINLYDKYNTLTVIGHITKLDPLTKSIFINKKPIKFTDIIKITINEEGFE